MDSKKVNDFVENITENLSETLKETFNQTLGQFADNEDIDAMKDAMVKSTKEMADAASDFIRKYPVQTVAGAVVIGFIIGNLNSRRKSL